jgi:hydrogenase maturation protein HypF
MVKAYLYRAGYRSPSANIRKMIDKGINSPLTSSAGRLFDAVGSIVLGKRNAAFEAELPIELERMVYEDTPGSYSFDIKNERGSFIISFSKTVRGVMKDSSKGLAKGAISAKFHNTVAEAILDTAKKIRGRFKIDKVVLSGGVFQNIYLKERTKVLLRKNGFDLNADSGVPINDSGIPIGQIAIANLRGVCA